MSFAFMGDNNIPGFDALCCPSVVKPVLASTRLNNPSVLSVRVKVRADALPRTDVPRNNGRILGFSND
jgi:hypothetical protein